MTRAPSVVVHALVGWAICGATIGVGRQLVSMTATLWIHAVVAPIAFALLTSDHFRRFPASSVPMTALANLATVVGLDAFLVAPVFEKSYAMFGSLLGTWVPFASIFAASYGVGSVHHRRSSRLVANACLGKELSGHTR